MSTSSAHLHRFRTATAVLVGFAVAAILIAVTVAASSSSGGPNRGSGTTWSQWHPPDSGTLGARDIADYIAPSYRIDPLNQLAVVTVVNLESANAAAAAATAAANGTATATGTATGVAVAIHPSPTSSAISLLGGSTIAYNLCGLGGKNCAIGVGTPSTSRLLLLRREALELALYTLHYLSGVQNVVTILPPGHTEVQSTLTRTLPTTDAKSKPLNVAVLFDRKELSPLLNHPLSDLLPETTPPTVSTMTKAPEAPLVEQVTGRGMFSEQLQQAQDGSNLIVLDPLPPQ